MNNHKPNRKKYLACIFMAYMSTSFLKIQPFYFCCNNRKIQDEVVVNPSITIATTITADLPTQNLVHSFNTLTQDDHSESASRIKPIMHKKFRHIVRRPPSIGMVAIGVPRYRDEDDSISE